MPVDAVLDLGRFKASGALLTSGVSNRTLANLVFVNASLDTNTAAAYFFDCSNIRVRDCVFINCGTGARFVSCTNVHFINNYVFNTTGAPPFSNAVQFDQCDGGSAFRNMIRHVYADTTAEDAINLYKTSNVEVHRNVIIGGGPSNSGGGILLGDSQGSNNNAHHNLLVNPGQYGVAIQGGANNRMADNVVYQAQSVPNGNVAFMIWDRLNLGDGFTGHVIENNRAYYQRHDGTLQTWTGFWQSANAAGKWTGSGNNWLDDTVTAAIAEMPTHTGTAGGAAADGDPTLLVRQQMKAFLGL